MVLQNTTFLISGCMLNYHLTLVVKSAFTACLTTLDAEDDSLGLGRCVVLQEMLVLPSNLKVTLGWSEIIGLCKVIIGTRYDGYHRWDDHPSIVSGSTW